MTEVHKLEPNCGSWIISNRRTGRAVVELFDPRTVEHINTEKYLVETALTYLQRINRGITQTKQTT